MMKAYINGMGIISPQRTFGSRDFLRSPVDYEQNYLRCIEPEYDPLIPAQYLRRMSRILKMGTGAALMAVHEASITRPDAIITGTGYGCLEDTATFLSQISTLREQALSPTPFMQSTHNTIGSQIALILQCTGYNQTYVHGAYSFEHALLDTMMHLSENPELNILVGGIDEWTLFRHAVENRFSKYRPEVTSTLRLLQTSERGTVAGEGAAYFVLSGAASTSTIASARGVTTFSDPPSGTVAQEVLTFLGDCDIDTADVDLVLTGKNGDLSVDRKMDAVMGLFDKASIGAFKHLCGEYSVASSFAMALAAAMIEQQYIPDFALLRNFNRFPQTILIYNSYFHQHTLILLQRCQPGKN